MGRPERLQLALTGIGETDAHDSMVLVIASTLHQTGRFGTVDELDRAVVAQQQVPRLTPAEEPAQAIAKLEQRLEVGGLELAVT